MDIQTFAPLALSSFGTEINAAVVGASGGIGSALADDLARCGSVSRVIRLSRSRLRTEHDKDTWIHLDVEKEETIAEAASSVRTLAGKLHLVIVASGILHDGEKLKPEKTWRALDGSSMEAVFRVNTIGPALVAKHLLPLLATDQRAAFAAISARVGSIQDNELGGWHAYRASKAALNMIIRNLAIELARRNTQALCVGLHPGTVDTALSEPFQSGVRQDRLFSPAHSARHLLTVIDGLGQPESGYVYAWDGKRIPF